MDKQDNNRKQKTFNDFIHAIGSEILIFNSYEV